MLNGVGVATLLSGRRVAAGRRRDNEEWDILETARSIEELKRFSIN